MMSDHYYKATKDSKVIYTDARIFITWASSGRFDVYSERDDRHRDAFCVEGLTYDEAVDIAHDYGQAHHDVRMD